jgi:hypothetical protein
MSRDRLWAKSKAVPWDTPGPEIREETIQSGLPARGGLGYHRATPSADGRGDDFGRRR